MKRVRRSPRLVVSWVTIQAESATNHGATARHLRAVSESRAHALNSVRESGMTIDQGLAARFKRHFATGNVILFTGAGFSYDAMARGASESRAFQRSSKSCRGSPSRDRLPTPCLPLATCTKWR